MSSGKVRKEIEVLNRSIDQGLDHGEEIRHSRTVFLVSDSKGKYLERRVRRRDIIDLKFICQSGANISSEHLKRLTLRAVRFERNPIVIIWLGTCDFMIKQGNFIKLVESAELTIEEVVSKFRVFKQNIQRVNPSSEVFFVECPPISISRWNVIKGGSDLDIYTTQDNRLKQIITTFNEKLNDLNGIVYLPKLSQDLVQSCKRKSHKVKYKTNFNLYVDGLHPSVNLAELWVLRLQNFIIRYLTSE